jgi:hypothetical protein
MNKGRVGEEWRGKEMADVSIRKHRWHICQLLAKAALTGVGWLKLVECHQPRPREDTLYQIYIYHRPQQITIC